VARMPLLKVISMPLKRKNILKDRWLELEEVLHQKLKLEFKQLLERKLEEMILVLVSLALSIRSVVGGIINPYNILDYGSINRTKVQTIAGLFEIKKWQEDLKHRKQQLKEI